MNSKQAIFYITSDLEYIGNLLEDEPPILLVVYILQELVNDNGIHTGAEQQVLITHTDVFVAHLLVVVHASNNEQITCGAHIDVLMDVSKR